MQDKLLKFYIPGIILLMTVGVVASLRLGYHPAPTDVMKPSFFDAPEAIGATVYNRFYGDIEARKRVVFGIPPQPDWQKQILIGFIRQAAVQNKPFDLVFAEEQMPTLDLSAVSPSTKVVTLPTNTETQAELINALGQSAGQRVLIYMPTIFSSHVLASAPILRLEQGLQQNLVSISSAGLALHPDQEYLLSPPCVGIVHDNGTSDLGCVILQSGRMYYRKNVPQTRWVAIMNEPKPDDYLLMVSEPGQDKDNAAANAKFRMAPPKPAIDVQGE